MGRSPKSISGLPGWKLLLPVQVRLANGRGKYHLPVDLGEEEMPCCLGQYERTVGTTESHQAGQPLLQS